MPRMCLCLNYWSILFVLLLVLASGCDQHQVTAKRMRLATTSSSELTPTTALPPGAQLGSAVAIDGDTVVVGAPFEAGSASQTGAAYVFYRTPAGWTQQARLTASNETPSAWFGTAVGIDGDHLVVGAFQHNHGDGVAGAAYLYTRSGGNVASATWADEVVISPPDVAYQDNFGRGVGISGDTVVVGADGVDDNGVDAGMVYVYSRAGADWVEQAALPGSKAGDQLGYAVAIDGDTIVAGAPGYGELDTNDPFLGDYTGAAFVFTRSSGTSSWSAQATLQQSPKQGYDFFGVSVSIAGDRAAIGASYYEARGYVFTRSGSSWSQQLRTDPAYSAESEYACRVAIDGDLLVIGNSGMFGSAYVFTSTSGAWTNELTLQGAAFGDGFGGAVAISGPRFVVGADTSGAAGTATVYELDLPTVNDAGVDAEPLDAIAPLDAIDQDVRSPDARVRADQTVDVASGDGSTADAPGLVPDAAAASSSGGDSGCGCVVHPSTEGWWLPALLLLLLLLVSLGRRSSGWLVLPLVLFFGQQTAEADTPPRTGWPVQIDHCPHRGLAVVDLQGDGKHEVVATCKLTIWIWDEDGKAVAGWPKQLPQHARRLPSAGDIDGDGDLEIVIATAETGDRLSPGAVHLFHHDGAEVSGWPVSFDHSPFGTIALADLDGKGGEELVVQVAESSEAGSIRVYSGNGALLSPGWNHATSSYPIAPAAVADIDGDASLDIVFATTTELSVRAADGSPLAGWPIPVATGKHYNDGGVAVADIDPSIPGLEIVAADHQAGGGFGECRLLAFSAAGAPLAGFPLLLHDSCFRLTPSSIGDVDGDGALEVISASQAQTSATVYVVNGDGTIESTFEPQSAPHGSAQLADLDGDQALEMLLDSNFAPSNSGSIAAYEIDGSVVDPFPLSTTGYTMGNSSSVGDLDGDGKLEVAAFSLSIYNDGGFVSVWSLPNAKQVAGSWPTAAHDVRRTNAYSSTKTPSSPDAGVAADAGAAADGAVDADAAAPVDGGPPAADSRDPDLASPDGGVGDAAGSSEPSSGCSCSLSNAGASSSVLWLLSLLACFRFKRLLGFLPPRVAPGQLSRWNRRRR